MGKLDRVVGLGARTERSGGLALAFASLTHKLSMTLAC